MIDRRHFMYHVVGGGFAMSSQSVSAVPILSARATVADFAQKARSLYHDPVVGAALSERLLTGDRLGDFVAAKTSGELVEKLNRIVEATTHDSHFMLMHGTMHVPLVPPTAPHSKTQSLTPAELELLRLRNFGFVAARIMPGNIGLLEVGQFYRPAAEVRQRLAIAMGYLADTSALIIDVADNPGGDPHCVALLVSYFFDRPPFVVNRFIWRQHPPELFQTSDNLEGPRYGEKRPLVVRVSSATFSAAEEFAYDVQALKRGAIVGEKTGGGANHALPVAIAGGIVAYIPQARAENPVTGSNWEGVGVIPEVEIGSAESLRTAHRLALEKVIAADRGARASHARSALASL